MQTDVPTKAVLLVEGISDQRAVEALARRRGRDLAAEGVAVVPMGGYGNVGPFVERFGAAEAELRLGCLYDADAERHIARALRRHGIAREPSRSALEALGFYACEADLEDELTRAVGPAGMEEVLAAQGELRSFRLYQRQPAHRDRSIEQQLWGFMWNRKAVYARLLVEAVDSDRVPRPLDRVLSHVLS